MGVVGLGKMGGGLAHQALDKDIRVVGVSRSGAPQELLKAGLVEIKDLGEFHSQLRPPRALLLYVPAGPSVDSIVSKLRP